MKFQGVDNEENYSCITRTKVLRPTREKLDYAEKKNTFIGYLPSGDLG